MVTSTSNFSETPFGAPPRPLNEAVLQSAEEAVLANPASADTLHDDEPASPAPGLPASAHPVPNRLARLVAERPFQATLAALAAGALLAALARLALARRHR